MSNPHSIIGYLQENFGQAGRLSANGQEFIMPSILVPDDYKKHFSINVDSGLWQDFKTGETGNFAKFLTIVENITYKRAKEKIFLMEFEQNDQTSVVSPDPQEEEFPEQLIPVNVSSCSSDNESLTKAWMLLYERKLFNLNHFEEEPYFIATEGKYENRLIIPFNNNNGHMFYFQARALDNQTPKYLNPIGETKPSHILYPFDETKDYVIVCEGPLDAISLKLEGVNSTCTMGCTVSEIQADILRDFGGKIILGYDMDKAGVRGTEKFEDLRKSKLMPEFYITPLPPLTKDWNDARMQGVDLTKWVTDNTTKYNYDYKILMGLSSL